MLESVGTQLGNFLGKYMGYDAVINSTAWRPYMRIRVEIDVGTPLKRWKKIRKSQGECLVLQFRYERLSLFCYICGLLGHANKLGDQLFTRKTDEFWREWSPELRAQMRRRIGYDGERWLQERTKNQGSESQLGV